MLLDSVHPRFHLVSFGNGVGEWMDFFVGRLGLQNSRHFLMKLAMSKAFQDVAAYCLGVQMVVVGLLCVGY